MNLQPVRGPRDILGKEALLKSKIESFFSAKCELYNFQKIETPLFESTNVFKRTLGETSDIVGKEMYTFDDRGGDSITLRPEGTAAVIRALISNGLTQSLPQRFFYMGPMFRYERPQKGRYRQFHQACVEYIGYASPLADVEVISLGYEFIKDLGVKDVTLHINTLGDINSRLAYRDALIDYFSKYKDDLSQDSQVRLLKNPLRILDSKDQKDQEIAKDAPLFEGYLNELSQSFYGQVLKGLETLQIPYVKQQTLVRGLDYYTHTAFEFKTTSLGAQDTILAGGRYDNLVKQMGGPEIPAVGFGMGIERLCLLLEGNDTYTKESPPFGIMPIQEDDFLFALQLVNKLRSAGLKCEFPLQGNLGKRFKQLDKYDCKYAIIFGSYEIEKSVVKVKNLKTDQLEEKEKTVSMDELVEFLMLCD